jgi:hypothetical protein
VCAAWRRNKHDSKLAAQVHYDGLVTTFTKCINISYVNAEYDSHRISECDCDADAIDDSNADGQRERNRHCDRLLDDNSIDKRNSLGDNNVNKLKDYNTDGQHKRNEQCNRLSISKRDRIADSDANPFGSWNCVENWN